MGEYDETNDMNNLFMISPTVKEILTISKIRGIGMKICDVTKCFELAA